MYHLLKSRLKEELKPDRTKCDGYRCSNEYWIAFCNQNSSIYDRKEAVHQETWKLKQNHPQITTIRNSSLFKWDFDQLSFFQKSINLYELLDIVIRFNLREIKKYSWRNFLLMSLFEEDPKMWEMPSIFLTHGDEVFFKKKKCEKSKFSITRFVMMSGN